MTIHKGLAVISGGSVVKHKFMDNGSGSLGTKGNVSALSGTISVTEAGNSYPDLVGQLGTTNGDVGTQTTDSINAMVETSSSVETVRSNMAASAYVDGNDNGHDYVAPSATTFLGSATSLRDADEKLDIALKAESDNLNVTVLGAAGVVGSLAHSIDTYLKGTTTTDAWTTLKGLADAMDNDTDLAGTITGKINQMKTDLRGGYTAGSLQTLSGAIVTHRDTAVTGAKAREFALHNKVNDATSSAGFTDTFGLSYVAQNYITGSEDTLVKADDALGVALKSRNDRLTATTGSQAAGGYAAGATTATLTVAAGATAAFSGSTSTTQFSAPTVSTLARMEQIGENGEVVYLNCTDYAGEVSASAGLIAKYPADKKFYFYEAGVWHPSPFADSSNL